MSNTYIKHYSDQRKCLAELGPYLQEHELRNSFILIELQKNHPEGVFTAILDKVTNAFIFGFLATKEYAFISKINTTPYDQQVCERLADLLVTELLSLSLPFEGIQGYEPELSLVLNAITKRNNLKLALKDDVWSYVIEKVKWSARSLEIKNDPKTLLYQATLDDLDWVTEWTQAFLNDDAGKTVVEPDLKQLCEQEIEGKNVYILFVNGVPVSMARKRRPLRDGCAMSMVYTPLEHRQKGYGGACVSMVTDVLLKEFKYVTLFVNANQDPYNNMYTRVGYKMHTKAGRSYKI